jgi:hypothetical protein
VVARQPALGASATGTLIGISGTEIAASGQVPLPANHEIVQLIQQAFVIRE